MDVYGPKLRQLLLKPNISKSAMFDHDYSKHTQLTDDNHVIRVKKLKKTKVFWTKEKMETAKRLSENGYLTTDIAIATGMSLRSVQRFIKMALLDDGCTWKEYVLPKVGRKKKDKSDLHVKLKEIIKYDRTLTLSQILCKLKSYDIELSKSSLSKELQIIGHAKRFVM